MKKILAAFLGLAAGAALANAQINLTILINFNGTNGAQPTCDLLQGPDGNLYGTTYGGGNLTLNSGLGYGSVFKYTPGGALTTLATFSYTNGEGPYGGVIQAGDGNYYGTTQLGGTNGNYGTLYQVKSNGVLTTEIYFNSTNGALPYDTLLQGSDGRLYGTTASGVPGTNAGTVFAYTINGGLTTLAAFSGIFPSGDTPWAGLLQGTNGLFYGTATTGGYDGYGTVFSVSTNGAVNTVVGFEPPSPNPANPYGGLTYGSDGLIYGTSNGGGSNYEGTVFKITASGTTNVVNFNGGNGAYPFGKLLLASNNYLYGMTEQGGPLSDGTIFKISPAGVLTTLFTFAHTNGQSPSAGLIQARDGNFYGLTRLGGNYSLGTLFCFSDNNTIPGPSLFLSLNTTNLIIQWTNNPADYTLQFTSSLLPPDWAAAFPLPTLVSNMYVYSNYISGNAGFYRLIQSSTR